jgi:hypothetical protein
MNDKHDDSQARIDWSWLDLDLIFYAVAGLVVIGLGVRALAHWTVESGLPAAACSRFWSLAVPPQR